MLKYQWLWGIERKSHEKDSKALVVCPDMLGLTGAALDLI
jgi:hypothetical protein